METKRNIKGFLRDTIGNKKSAMRLALLCVLCLAGIIVGSVATHIVILSYKGLSVDWSGIAVLVSALSAFIGTAIAGKWLQKKEEK